MKKNKGLIVCIIIIILLVCVLLAVIVPPLIKEKGGTEGDKEKGNKEVVETYTVEEAEKLLQKFGFDYNLGCDKLILDSDYNEVFKQIVALKNVDGSKVSSTACSDLFTTLNGEGYAYQGEMGVCSKDSSTSVISYADANEVYKNMFGEEMPKKSIDSTKLGSLFYIFYDYSADKDSFISVKCNGCGGSCGNSFHVFDVLEPHVNGNQLVVDVAYYYSGNFELSGDNQYHLVTTKTDEMIECSSLEDCQEKLQTLNDKLDQYSVTFEKTNDNYILKTISKK